jgi:hypothetical protein
MLCLTVWFMLYKNGFRFVCQTHCGVCSCHLCLRLGCEVSAFVGVVCALRAWQEVQVDLFPFRISLAVGGEVGLLHVDWPLELRSVMKDLCPLLFFCLYAVRQLSLREAGTWPSCSNSSQVAKPWHASWSTCGTATMLAFFKTRDTSPVRRVCLVTLSQSVAMAY